MSKYNDISHFSRQGLQGIFGMLAPSKPWDNITDFATHPSFCGQAPYPRQLTLLKLMYLETENMTDYDRDVINEWRMGFGGKRSIGVPEDIWDRVEFLKKAGYRRFTHVLSVLGRRASKGWVGGIVGTETIAYMVSLGDWQKHYGIQPQKEGYISCLATSLDQAKKFQFADIKNVVLKCEYLRPWTHTVKDHLMWFRTPADVEYIANMQRRGQFIESETATLRVVAMTSNSASGRGGAGFANFYDEFAHMIVGTAGPRASEEVYAAYQPSLQQFGKDQLTYIPSSPYSKVGQFFNLYTQGSALIPEYQEANGIFVPKEITASDFETDPEELFKESIADPSMLVVQLPSWELYRDWDKAKDLTGIGKTTAFVEMDSIEMKRERNLNKTRFRVEYEAQFAEVEDQYLDPDMVDRIFEPWPTERDVLTPATHGHLDIIYHGHADPGRTNANFAVAFSHLEDAPEPDDYGNYWPHVVIDYMKVWKPKDFPDNTIDYVKVEHELSLALSKFPSMEKFTFDQWNSASLIAKLSAEHPAIRIGEVTATDRVNQERYEKFKSAINLGWVHSYRDDFYDKSEGISLLEQELKFLSEVNGKVVKQDVGPVTTKDLSDCVVEITVRQLDQFLSAYSKMGKLTLNSTSSSTQVINGATRAGAMASPQQAQTMRDGLNAIANSNYRSVPMGNPARGGFGNRSGFGGMSTRGRGGSGGTRGRGR